MDKPCYIRTLPAVYDDALTYYEQLKRIVKALNEVIEQLNGSEVDYTTILEKIKELEAEYTELAELLDQIKNGDYVYLYLDSITKWIDENVQTLVGRIVKFVSFELDDSGYLLAYIPQTWTFLEFDTCMVYDSPDYGRLILHY